MKRKILSVLVCLSMLLTMLPASAIAGSSDELGGTVTITGTLKFGEELTANTTSLTGNTGVLTYTWKRGEDTVGTDQATYTTEEDDIGQTITCEVKSSVETGTITGTASAVIAKLDGPAAPSVVRIATDPANEILVVGEEDKITVTIGENMTAPYEYLFNDGQVWADLTPGEISTLTSTSIQIRVKATATEEAGTVTAIVIKTRLMLPENKKLAGYNQESKSDRAWVLKNLSAKDNLYTYIQRLKVDYGYTERELLYLYPATALSTEIIYYTDELMTHPTTTDAHGAVTDGGVPDVVGTYYRKAVFTGGTEEGITYPEKVASSLFYVVSELEGNTRRGFSLSLTQPKYKTANGLPRGVDKPFASVDEGWSWSPATEGTPAILTMKDYHQEGAWKGIPIAQRAPAFEEEGGTGPAADSSLYKIITNMKILFTKMKELGGSVILPGFEQVELQLKGTNQITRVPTGASGQNGLYVCNYEAAPLSDLLGLLGVKGADGYTKNAAVNVLGMEDKRLLLTGNGTLNVDGNVRSPAGISVGNEVTLNVTGSIETRLFNSEGNLFNRNKANEPESVMKQYTYSGSTKNPTDVSVNLQGRVNIQYKDNYGIYSTGKLSADKANLSVAQTTENNGQLDNAAGLSAANGVTINNSTVTVTGKGSPNASISARELLSVTDSTLTTSGYDYGLAVFGLYKNDTFPASLLIQDGTTQISAKKVAVYASDAAVTQDNANTDGVEVTIYDLFGTLAGGNHAVYAYTQNADPEPTRTVSFSASPKANTVTPNGVIVGTVLDSEKTVATLLENSSSTTAAKYVSANIYYPPSNGGGSSGGSSNNQMPVDDKKTIEDKDPVDDKEPSEPTEIIFDDVSKDAWYYNAVQYAAQNKLLIGTTGNEFSPNVPMDRAMMITLLYRMAGEPVVTGTMPFTDVDASAYYENALIWASQNNLAYGNPDGTFGTAKAVTRQDLLVFLYRYANPSVGSGDVPSSFNDMADVSHYAMDAMVWAVSKGIIQGDENKNLNPNDPATRAQTAAIMQRYQNL